MEYRMETPKVGFNNYVRVFDNRFLQVTTKGMDIVHYLPVFDELISETFMEGFDTSLKMIEGVSLEGLGFSRLILVGHEIHRMHLAKDENLHKQCIVAFPAFACEFGGWESSEEIRSLRDDFIPSTDWRRSPCPKIEMWYDNPKTGSGSVGDSLGFARIETCQRIFRQLNGSGGLMKLRNFSGKTLNICSETNDTYVFTTTEDKEIYDTQNALLELKYYVYGPDLHWV